MKKTPIDYTKMNELTKKLGMVPHTDRGGQIVIGQYTLADLHAPVDLSACALDEISILKTALRQLSEQSEEAHQRACDRMFED